MNLDLEKFSYRLTVLLDENNMKQTELAKKVGISNVTICRYLTAERIPRLDVVIKIGLFDFETQLPIAIYSFLISTTLNIPISIIGLSNDKVINDSEDNYDFNILAIIDKLYSLEKGVNLSKSQIELIKKLLLANKDFILSA